MARSPSCHRCHLAGIYPWPPAGSPEPTGGRTRSSSRAGEASRPASDTTRVNRAGRNSRSSAYAPTAESTGRACRHTCGSALTLLAPYGAQGGELALVESGNHGVGPRAAPLVVGTASRPPTLAVWPRSGSSLCCSASDIGCHPARPERHSGHPARRGVRTLRAHIPRPRSHCFTVQATLVGPQTGDGPMAIEAIDVRDEARSAMRPSAQMRPKVRT